MNAQLMVRTSSCACGRVKCEGAGEPILSAVCYCDDCQAGGRQIEKLDNAPPVLDADDGSACLVYRDDRFRCVSGKELLVGYKLAERSPTNRFVASCCNSAMYLKYRRGHWVSAYCNRFAGELPPIGMRSQTQFRDSGLPIPQDAPSYRSFPLKLFARLLIARLAMAFGR